MTICRAVVRILLAVGAVALVAIFLLELKRRHDLYWYDVRQDYHYSFRGNEVRRVPVRVDGESVEIPSLGDGWDTAFLSLDIRSSPSSYWFEPWVEIVGETARWTQFLERRADGIRYLVLRPDALRHNRKLTLRGRHVRWEAQESELLLFRNPDVSAARILVLAPHPDDAEIAAFGLYSQTDSWVVTVSAGNYVDGHYAHLSPDKEVQNRLRGKVRAWDSIAVPAWGGVTPDRVVNFGYSNGSLGSLYEHRSGALSAGTAADDPSRFRRGAIDELLDGRPTEASWESLVEDVEAVLGNVEPDLIVAPHPLIDAADDHRFTTLALLEALERAGDRVTPLLLYTNHHILSEYYPFGPSYSAVTLPPLLDDRIGETGLYSWWLTEEDQMSKLFALEAMHDLRPGPTALRGGPTQRFLILVTTAFNGMIRNPLGTYSYIRRSVRANELFFVVPPSGRRQLRNGIIAPGA